MKRKVGIVTEHRARNFGSCLQAYALQESLRLLGVETKIIDYRPQAIEDSFGIFIKDLYFQAKDNFISLISFWIKTVIFSPKRFQREKNFQKFRNQYFSLTNEKFDDSNINDNNLDFDFFFYGSDQIWNPKITKGLCPAYFGIPFKSNPNSIHASYAASIGINNLDGYDAIFQEYLMNLDYISVREKSAKELLSKLTIKPIDVVLDPTLILPENYWKNIIHEVPERNYILVYSLKIDNNLINYVKRISEEKKMSVVFFDLRKRYGKRSISHYTANPADFLSYVNKAEYVITNSFHGTVFSIIFRKKFVCIPMEGTSSRMVNLLELLEMTDRLFNLNVNIDNKIDYEKIHNQLDIYRNQSISYLKKVLANNE